MKILITGGTGFIGQILCHDLVEQGHELTVLSRQSTAKVKQKCGDQVKVIQSINEVSSESHIDAIINLAGEPIADARWTNARKETLCASRHEMTKDLVALIDRLTTKPSVFISGSAVGYYGDQGQTPVSEDTHPNPEFTHDLCRTWENIALKAEPHTRVCLLRTGLVIGASGGFLAKMWLPFKLGMGGKLGNGQQYMPWIHMTDMIAIINRLLIKEDLFGPFNATAPTPVTNEVFSKTLAKSISRPCLVTTPGFVLKIILGEMSRLLLTGQNAQPQKLLDDGFEFSFTSIDAALKDVIRDKGYFY